MRLSLVKKLNLIIIGTILFLTMIITYSLYYVTLDKISVLEKSNLLFNAQQSAREIETHFEYTIEKIETIKSGHGLAAYLSQKPIVEQDQEILAAFEHNNNAGDFLAIYLMDLDGKVLISTDENFLGKNYNFRDYFKQASEGNDFVGVARGATSKEVGYYFSFPIKNDDGLVRGVLVGKLNPKIIHKAISVDLNKKDANILFTDEYGIVIYATDKDKFYKSLGELNEEEKNAILKKRRFDGLHIKSLDYEEIQNHLRGKDKFAVFDIYDSYDKEEEVVAIVNLGKLPFNLILEEDAENISVISIKVAEIVSMVIIIFALIISLLIGFFINKFLKPLTKLDEAIKKIETGELSYRLDIKSGDEFGDIANGFNRMASKLEKNIEGIEKKVNERTKTLEELNKHMIGRELRMVELKRKINRSKKDNK